MRTIGNLLWFILGGFFYGLSVGWLYALLAFVFRLLVIPWGRACFVLGKFAFIAIWPRRQLIFRRELTQTW